MKNEKLAVAGTLIIAFVFSAFAMRPTNMQGENVSIVSPTPSPRTKRPKAIQSPVTILSPRPIRTPNAGKNPSKVIRDGKLTDNERSQITTPSATGSKTVGGLSTETERTAKAKGKSPTSSGDQPEMQINSTQNTRKVKKPKNQTLEVENDETHRTQNPAYREGGVNDSTVRKGRTPNGMLKIEGVDGDRIVTTASPHKTPTPQPAKRKVKKPRN